MKADSDGDRRARKIYPVKPESDPGAGAAGWRVCRVARWTSSGEDVNANTARQGRGGAHHVGDSVPAFGVSNCESI